MKIGTETGSLTNHIMSGGRGGPDPVPGMGATLLMWSDRHACTVVRVFIFRGRRCVAVKEDHAQRTDSNGQSESQTYEFFPNPEAPERTFEERPNGQWRERGTRGKGTGLHLGSRDSYRDPSF